MRTSQEDREGKQVTLTRILTDDDFKKIGKESRSP
jgi:hypothetical protein